MGVLMEVKDLTVRFDTQDGVVHAVNGVSYTLNEGEILGVVGESGSGKSVHVLSMLRLIPTPPGRVTAGQVIFDGDDLLTMPIDKLRNVRGGQIGMIFQDPMTSLNPVLTIGLQITEVLTLHLKMTQKEADDRAAELLGMVGIPDARRRLNDYPHQFSGGMRQRVMIAVGLACNPKLLIADEPTTALDVTIQAQIIDLVRRLQDKIGMAIIWITHDLGVVAGLADTLQVMYAGRVVERGPVRSLFKDARNAYTLGLLNSLPRPDQKRGSRLVQIGGMPPDLTMLPPGDPFAPRNPYVTERCWVETPPLLPAPDASPDHLVAAWYDLRTAVITQPAALEVLE